MIIIKNKYFIISLVFIFGLIITFGLMEIALSGGGNGGTSGGNTCSQPVDTNEVGHFGVGTNANSSDGVGDGSSTGNGSSWNFPDVSLPPPPPALTLSAVTPYGTFASPAATIIAEGQDVNLNWTSNRVVQNSCNTSCTSNICPEDWTGSGRPNEDTGPNYTYSNLTEGIYGFRIECETTLGNPISSNISVEVRKPTLVLSSVSKNCNVNNLKWEWQNLFDAYEREIQRYELYRGDTRLAIINHSHGTHSYTHSDQGPFPSGQSYEYEVRAIRSASPSPVIASRNITPCPPLPKWQEVIPKI